MMSRSLFVYVAIACFIVCISAVSTAQTAFAVNIDSLWSDADAWGGLADRRPSALSERLRAAQAHQDRNQWLIAEDAYAAFIRNCSPITPQTIELKQTALLESGISQAMSGKPDAARRTLDAVESGYSGTVAASDIGRLRFVIGFAYFISSSNAARAENGAEPELWYGAHTIRRIFNLSGETLSMPDSAFSGATALFSETLSVADATEKALAVFDGIAARDPDGAYADNALLISGILLRKS